jgi:CHRD domain
MSPASKLKWLCYVLILISISCKHEIQPKSNFELSGPANGGQMVPKVTTTASGSIKGNYYKPFKVLSFTISWDSLSGVPTGLYFNGPALAGATASEIHAFTGFSAVQNNGSYSGYITLSSQVEETELMAGQWYFNIKTALNTNGEIRGQMRIQ